MKIFLLFLSLLLCSSFTYAEANTTDWLNLTGHWVGYASIICFIFAYLLVILEDRIHMRKSKPVMAVAAIIWLFIAYAYHSHGLPEMVEEGIRHNFLEYAELFFFLLVAMTYINSMLELGVFDALRDWLIAKGFSFKQLFWLTGLLAFSISPVFDNLTTALIMCAVVLAVGKGQPTFVALSCIGIVLGANAGGAFSPFGDITSLMVWQKEKLKFWTFFTLFIPALVNFMVPACFMHFAIPAGNPVKQALTESPLKPGGLVVVGLFLVTIATAVICHNYLHMPSVFGMMTGLVYLKFFGFYLRRKALHSASGSEIPPGDSVSEPFDVFDSIAKSEWDTLFFFYGVIMAVGGLGFIGYLSLASEFIYGELGATTANILIGLLSALVDNIPVMFAVLSMDPHMTEFQWLLVTLTAGVGGSLLSIGSAAGVALMGQARGQYTFFSHLKWTPAIALGYAASIWVHFLINS